MPRKVYVKPPPPTRTVLWAQIIVAALFLPFGVFLLSSAEGEARPFVLIFFVAWVVVCLAIIVNAARWLSLVKKGSIEVAEIAGTEGEAEGDFAVRLRALEDLRKDELISESEYQAKRAEILREKW